MDIKYEMDDGFTFLEWFMLGLIEEDTCPKCLGELNGEWECIKCGYDAMPLVTNNMPE